MKNDPLSRRGMLAGAATAAVSAAGVVSAKANAVSPQAGEAQASTASVNAGSGRLNQGVCYWCYQKKMSLEEMATEAAKLGLAGIDLIDPKDFPLLKKHGLVSTMTPSHSLQNGLCEPKFHDQALEEINAAIEATAAEGWKNVICFSGNARGIDRETGMKSCVAALRKIVPVAEKAGVVLQMELLNSKVNHADYMCDNSTWGIELVKRVGSDNFKLLYDIYHMQIMEGDIIRTIQDNHQFFGHYHTGGNPGRNELDETQELFYPAIANAIAETGYDGYYCHEFIPKRDPIAGLTDAVKQSIV